MLKQMVENDDENEPEIMQEEQKGKGFFELLSDGVKEYVLFLKYLTVKLGF